MTQTKQFEWLPFLLFLSFEIILSPLLLLSVWSFEFQYDNKMAQLNLLGRILAFGCWSFCAIFAYMFYHDMVTD